MPKVSSMPESLTSISNSPRSISNSSLNYAEDRIASLLSFPVEGGDEAGQSEIYTTKQPSLGVANDNGARLAGMSNNIVAFRTSSSTAVS